MSFGMFCAIPLRFRVWDEACAGLMLPCFPLVGAVIGAVWYGAAWLMAISGVHNVFAAAVTAVAPFILSGFLHLDGYADTSDAVLSRRPFEEKLRILKDPHMGVFSVVMIAVLFLLQFAAVYAVIDRGIPLAPLVVIPVVSRCCAALALLCLDTMPQSGYGTLFRQNARAVHRIFVAAIAVSAVALAWLFTGALGLATVILTVAGFTAAMAYVRAEFNGVSGDLAGFSLVVSELCGLIALGVMTCC